MNPQKGSVVIAKAGRDKGKFFVVTEVLNDRFVLIADGKRRKLENPKKKNLIHFSVTGTALGDFTSNRKLKQFLNSFPTGG